MTRLAFLSSTCPEWTFEQMVDAAAKYGYAGVDLRDFGGNLPEGYTMADLRPAVAAAAPFGVAPCLEVHDQHNNPADVAWIVEHAGSGNSGVVWHPSHHSRLGISVDEAYPVLRPWVRHLHLQDWPKEGREPAGEAGVAGARRGFVPIGEGDGYLARVFQLLERDDFDGFGADEWIIKRHAEPDPDAYLPAAARQLRAWLEEARRPA